MAAGRAVIDQTVFSAVVVMVILTTIITSAFDPGSWTEDGGPAVIGYFPGTKLLVIRQSRDIHREIEELIKKLSVDLPREAP